MRFALLSMVTCTLVVACSSTSPDNNDAGKDAAATNPLGFTPSNIDLSGIDLTKVGDFTTDNTCTIQSDSLVASCGNGNDALQYKVATQSDGTKVGVYVAKTISIPVGTSLTVAGPYPIVLVALDTIDIRGTLSASAQAGTTVAGGGIQTVAESKGGGLGGGGAGSLTNAGGGGSYCGIGGAGAQENGTNSSGGVAYGTSALVPLAGGSSGGEAEGDPGAGGGAIQLVAGSSINVAAGGAINVGGGGGEFGGAASTQEANGGGSGGGILLESKLVTIAGTLAANGGGGGQGAIGNSGGDATANDQPALGGQDNTKGSFGGNGSASANVNGADGSVTLGSTAGGGGGGAGRIRINTKSGAATLSGTISPAATTACTTQGTVLP